MTLRHCHSLLTVEWPKGLEAWAEQAEWLDAQAQKRGYDCLLVPPTTSKGKLTER